MISKISKYLKSIIRGFAFRVFYPHARIGKDFRIYGSLRLRSKPKVLVIGNSVRILGDVVLDFYSKGELNIGVGVVLDTCIISPRNGEINIGNESFIGPFSIVQAFDTGPVSIGKNVMIAKGCSIFASNHGFETIGLPMKNQKEIGKGISIGNDIWIGTNSVVLDGIKIADGSIIAAGAVVTKDTEMNGIYAGVPARKIRER